MYEPLISIYITSHNYARFFEDAIESALNQTYKKTEIIIYDDCSEDGSQEIIKKYSKIYLISFLKLALEILVVIGIFFFHNVHIGF